MTRSSATGLLFGKAQPTKLVWPSRAENVTVWVVARIAKLFGGCDHFPFKRTRSTLRWVKMHHAQYDDHGLIRRIDFLLITMKKTISKLRSVCGYVNIDLGAS